jgi:hypothetical protein
MLCIDIHENKLSSAISALGMKERILVLKYPLKYPCIQLGAKLRPSLSNDFIAQLAFTSRYCTSHKYANPNNDSQDEAMTLVTLPSLHRQISCNKLTPKGRRPFFGPFLDIGQAIVDAIFVQKISNFW